MTISEIASETPSDVCVAKAPVAPAEAKEQSKEDVVVAPLEMPAAAAAEAKTKKSFMEAATSKALRPFVIISSSYLLFTITDGAIRMIVLLHAYNKAFSALQVAIMFTLYELAGVVTNLVRKLQERCSTYIWGGYHP